MNRTLLDDYLTAVRKNAFADLSMSLGLTPNDGVAAAKYVRVEIPTTKVVQIFVTPVVHTRRWWFSREVRETKRVLYALCDDGSIWQIKHDEPWHCVHPAPVSPSVLTTAVGETHGPEYTRPFVGTLSLDNTSPKAKPKPVRRAPAKAAVAPQAKSPSRSMKKGKVK